MPAQHECVANGGALGRKIPGQLWSRGEEVPDNHQVTPTNSSLYLWLMVFGASSPDVANLRVSEELKPKQLLHNF